MNYFTPLPGLSEPVDFTSSTLVLPQPSLASIAQLACDLIIANFQLTRVGFLGLRDHVPAVSGLDTLPGKETAPDGISYSVEVFQVPSRSLTVVLPRSPVIRARRPHYLASMRQFIAQGQFKEVLLVAGVDAALRNDEGLNSSSPLRHFLLPNPSSPSLLDLASVSTPYSLASGSDALPLVPHGGMTRRLLDTLQSSDSTDLPAVSALLIYTFETTEPETAFFLADALTSVLKKELEGLESRIENLQLGDNPEEERPQGAIKWKVPKSWETGLMGAELPLDHRTDMFG
ncbi:uncharacterized protein JCM15063_000198 [Sporobolomyces koalae]|uniref:uncharacterized protein n=1 Tax=Sporobolomyces koalae TaxID=500713 RepID=UPI00317AA8D7